MTSSLAAFQAPKVEPRVRRSDVATRRRVGVGVDTSSAHRIRDSRRWHNSELEALRNDVVMARGARGRRQLIFSGGIQLMMLSSSDDALAAATAARASASRPETVVYVGLTIDGYIARPDGSVDYLPTPSGDDGGGEDFGFADLLSRVDAVVMGRRTFQQVAEFVVNDGVPWPYGDTRVIVISKTMRRRDIPPTLSDKVTVSDASPLETLRTMGEGGHSRRVYVDGGSVIRSLLEEDAVDEMVLTSVPVTIGRGVSLWGFDPKAKRDYRWTVASTESFRNQGLVKTTYRRQREE